MEDEKNIQIEGNKSLGKPERLPFSKGIERSPLS